MLRPHLLLLVCACVCLLSGKTALADTTAAVHWQWAELIPPSEPFHDPFLDLSQDQLDDLGYLVGLAEDISALEQRDPGYFRLEAMRAERDQLTQALSQQGVYVELLLSQRKGVAEARERQATATADEKLGTHGSLRGFLVPLDSVNDSVSRYFLVQFSPLQAYGHDHTSPHPNQTILLELVQRWDYPLECPVLVSGKLQSKRSRQAVTNPDGHEALMESVYSLDDATVKRVQVKGARECNQATAAAGQ